MICNNHFGPSSWNDFFTRRFRPDARWSFPRLTSRLSSAPAKRRPITSSKTPNFKIASGSNRNRTHWRTSLLRVNAVSHIGSGSVYQAFLSAYNYHRWHPPAERVNEFATPGCLHSVIKRQVLCGFGIPSFLGGLIHAATGNSGGRGVTRLKRSGWARKAASRVAQRVLVSA